MLHAIEMTGIVMVAFYSTAISIVGYLAYKAGKDDQKTQEKYSKNLASQEAKLLKY